MSRFVLTAQLQLQAPSNVRQVVQQIQSQLNGVTVNLQVQNAAQSQRQIQQVAQATNQATTAAERMGKAFALSIRRFAAFSIATRAVGLFTSTLSDAVQTSIDFERQLIKIAQVTGKSVGQLRGLTKEITSLSTGFGVASSDLLEVSTILAQAGLSADDTSTALRTLAKAALAPNFDSISETAEGAIAILAQFQEGVGALEKQLGSINAVAGAFAVEASDLIDVIRRTGGVFKASGGDLNELLALFTSVRATTRESAESIGTGLRTIFTRIQRPKTIEFLKQFGVELVDLDGKFVGPYEAIKRLSGALAGLGEGDISFIRIAEELGGFRQIGKVLPLLQQFSTAQSALNVAMKAGDSLTQDAASAQAALAIRIMKVKEEFLALIRSVTETSTFQIMANTALSLASALIKIGDAIKPLLPMLGALAAIKLAKGMSSFFGGMMSGAASGRAYNKGGKVLGFARGGLVPGTGNRDTVPAMLSPGEFVIRKSSVNKMGAGTLAAMNENRYAAGGIVVDPNKIGAFFLRPEKGADRNPIKISGSSSIKNPLALAQLGMLPKASEARKQAIDNMSVDKQAKLFGFARTRSTKKINSNDLFDSKGNLLQSENKTKELFRNANYSVEDTRNLDINRIQSRLDRGIAKGKLSIGSQSVPMSGFISGYFPGMDDLQNSNVAKIIADNTKKGLYNTILKSVDPVISALNNPNISINTSQAKSGAKRIANDPNAQATTQGFAFEGLIQSITGAKLAGNQANFDFPNVRSASSALKNMFTDSTGEGLDSLIKADAKRSNTTDAIDSIKNKIANDINRGKFEGISFVKKFFGGMIQKFATGGGVGTDTVPALLTPGEFVVNRSSAQRIGYGNLHRMNKVGKYAKGGVVQHFAAGGAATATSSSTAGIDSLDKSAKNASRSMGDVINSNKMFALSMTTSLMQGFLPAVDENSSGLLKATHSLMNLVTTITSVGFALEAFGVALNAQSILKFISGASSFTDIIKNISGQFSGFGKAINDINGKLGQFKLSSLFSGSKTVNRLAKSASSGFSQGMKGMPGAQAYFARGASPFMKNLSIGATKVGAFSGQAIGRIVDSPIGRSVNNFRAGLGVGANQGLGANQLVRNIAGAAGRSGMAGQVVGSVGTSISSTIKGMVTNFNQMAGPTIAVSLGFKAISGVIDSYLGYQEKLNKAISEGSVVEAEKNAAQAAGSDAVNSLSTGLIGLGSLFGPPGVAIAGVTAGLIKLGSELPIMGSTIKSTASYIMQGFGGDTLSSTEAFAASQAGAIQTQKSLQKAQIEATKVMKDFENGTISASIALSRIQAATQDANTQERRASKAAEENLQNRNTGGVRGYFRDVFSNLTLGLVENVETRNTRLGKKGAEEINQASKLQSEAFQIQTSARTADIRSGFFAGQSKEDIRKKALGIGTENDKIARMRKLSDTATKLSEAGDYVGAEAAHEAFRQLASEVRQVNQEINNLEKEVKAAKDKFAALNLGFRSITSAADATALKMDNLMSSLEEGNNPASRAAATLQAAMTEAGQNISKVDFDSALNEVNNVFKAFGASKQQIDKFNGLAEGVAGVQRNFPEIVETLKKKLLSGELKDINNPTKVGEEFKKIIGQELANSKLAPAVQKQILDAMGDVKLESEDVQKLLGPEPDYSVLEKYFGDASDEVTKMMTAVFEKQAKIQQQLIELAKRRIDAERNLVEAQKEALDLIMEGREIQAKYGGREVTNEERRQNVLAKSNVEGSRLGLSNMKSGNVPELRRRNLEILGGFANIENGRRRDGGLQGTRGAEQGELQRDLQKAYKTQIDTIRSLIKLEEDQLKITEEKNKLEKESLESLVKGDIESFFKQQAAVGARAAIASGDQRSMNLYGSEALGAAALDIQRQKDAGVQSLYGQRLGGAGGLAEAAAAAALSSMGVTDMRSAQVLAGTTGEEEASKARLRELGGLLGETGQIGVEMAEMQVGTATIYAQKAEFIASNSATGGNPPVQKRANGGLIYASRGMFVPRGSDTVPAMLTPGEFVVSRSAVQRGNNLQILSAMNGGSSSPSSTQSESVKMSRGGIVKYFDNGGKVEANESNPMGSFDNQIMNKFAESLSSFNRNLTLNIDKLKQTSINIKLDSTNVNVNLNDGGLLKALKEEVKKELLTVISNQFKLDNNGNIRRNQTVLG